MCTSTLLQAQPDYPTKQAEARREFTEALGIISQRRKGKFFFGEDISLVDIAIEPWAVRDSIAADYRGFQRDQVPSWREWAKVLEQHPTVRKTTSVCHLCLMDTVEKPLTMNRMLLNIFNLMA